MGTAPVNVEVFSCSGGMAEGFRRAGIIFDVAIEREPEHCDSYEANLGHRPICMDARDFLRLAKLGLLKGRIRLLVADPPCTPWSRAGKRLGVEDERDMLHATCELILLLQPDAYLIGNVPGLEDSTQWHHLQSALAPLAKAGYCIRDFTTLDAADFGVPQHRVRPFWFGHRAGPCVAWPMPTHCDPEELLRGSLQLHPLKPWVTCRDALGHLSLEQLGRPVRLRKRSQHSPQHGSVMGRPARVVGTSNLSDGNVLLNPSHPPSRLDEPALCVRAGRANGGVQGGRALALPEVLDLKNSPLHDQDAPMRTVTTQSQYTSRLPVPRPGQGNRVGTADVPGAVLTSKPPRVGAGEGQVLEWPWDRPGTTIQRDERMAPPGHKPEDWGNIMSNPNAVVLSELGGTILQGFPESWTFAGATKRTRWSQLGQAMPPPLAEAVARSIAEQMKKTEERND